MNEVTIRDLATAFLSSDHLEYKKLLDNTNISKDAKKFLLRKSPEMRFGENCLEFRKNQMLLLEDSLGKQIGRASCRERVYAPV